MSCIFLLDHLFEFSYILDLLVTAHVFRWDRWAVHLLFFWFLGKASPSFFCVFPVWPQPKGWWVHRVQLLCICLGEAEHKDLASLPRGAQQEFGVLGGQDGRTPSADRLISGRYWMHTTHSSSHVRPTPYALVTARRNISRNSAERWWRLHRKSATYQPGPLRTSSLLIV